MNKTDKVFVILIAILSLCGFFLGFCYPVHAQGPGPIPFNPSFVTGSGSVNCTPTNQLCFNTTGSQYGAYVWNPFTSAWAQYGGGGTGCSGSAGDILFTSTGSNCTGASLQWNGAQLVWAANGRLDDPGDITTSGGFDITVGGGGNFGYTTGLNIEVSGGALLLGASDAIDIGAPVVNINGLPLGPFATADSTASTAALNLFTSSLQGVVPGSGGETTDFLRADGTWAAPAGSTVTWPASGSVVVSNGTNTPAAVSPSCDQAMIAAGGVWSCGAIPAVAGGSSGLYSPPPAASLTTFTGDTSTPVLTDTSYGLVIDMGASNASALRGAIQPLTATPWAITGGLKITETPFNFRYCGLVISDGTKFELFEYQDGGTPVSPGPALQVQTWNNSTTVLSNLVSTQAAPIPYMKITDDGTNRQFLISADGRNYALIYTETSATFFTPTEAGFACNVNNNSGPSGDHLFETVFYWSNT